MQIKNKGKRKTWYGAPDIVNELQPRGGKKSDSLMGNEHKKSAETGENTTNPAMQKKGKSKAGGFYSRFGTCYGENIT